MMFASLHEQSPLILMSLGLSPEQIQNEMKKINNIAKMKVCDDLTVVLFQSFFYHVVKQTSQLPLSQLVCSNCPVVINGWLFFCATGSILLNGLNSYSHSINFSIDQFMNTV